MHAELHWIDGPWHGRLAVAARPRGSDWIEDEIAGWHHAGVDVVVSLLTNQESVGLDLEREEEICRTKGVGRSSLIAIGALLYEGTSLDAAIAEVGRARGLQVPETGGQRKWLEHFQSVRDQAGIARTG
jgi:hypothetical protein